MILFIYMINTLKRLELKRLAATSKHLQLLLLLSRYLPDGTLCLRNNDRLEFRLDVIV